MILLNDFKRQWSDTRQAVLCAIDLFGANGWYILGEEVAAFEAAVARLFGVQYCIGVGSGLDAIEISLRVSGCGPGDRVITTPLTAFASTLAIIRVGAVPVFVDTDQFGLIDLNQCEGVLQEGDGNHFILPVHLYGHVVNLSRLQQVRSKFGCAIIEDCAQAIMAGFEGQLAGSIGECSAVSFYPTKNLGSLGDGGAVLTNLESHRSAARCLRDYGQTSKYCHTHLGFNSRLDELQAAVMHRVYLQKLGEWTERRREIARLYTNAIIHDLLHVPGYPVGSDSTWHLFPILVPPGRRAEFISYLASRGIASGVHYPVLVFDQPAMADVPYERLSNCDTARRISTSEVSLPIHPYLSDSEVERVIQVCNEWAG